MKDIRRLTRWGFGLSLLFLVILHFLKPEFNIFSSPVSEYANGKLGILMILSFVLFGFGLIGLAFQTYKSIPNKNLRMVFSFLFLMSAFSSVIMGLFTVNLQGTPSNISAVIHKQTSPIWVVTLLLAMTYSSLRLKEIPEHFKTFRVSGTLGLLSWIGFALLISLSSNPDYIGMVQRIFVLAVWLWVMHLSVKLT